MPYLLYLVLVVRDSWLVVRDLWCASSWRAGLARPFTHCPPITHLPSLTQSPTHCSSLTLTHSLKKKLTTPEAHSLTHHPLTHSRPRTLTHKAHADHLRLDHPGSLWLTNAHGVIPSLAHSLRKRLSHTAIKTHLWRRVTGFMEYCSDARVARQHSVGQHRFIHDAFESELESKLWQQRSTNLFCCQ